MKVGSKCQVAIRGYTGVGKVVEIRDGARGEWYFVECKDGRTVGARLANLSKVR